MPKVMMIGKVSKLRSRTRRAGSFKGSLGTVVLEGSRAQSRRYGMGNIAGSPEEHRAIAMSSFTSAKAALTNAQRATRCSSRVQHAMSALEMLEEATVEASWARTGTIPEARSLRAQAARIITSCIRPDSSGMSGARRRRSR